MEMISCSIPWVGMIPEGWNTIKIKQIADPTVEFSYIDGDWIESPYITDHGIRYLTTGNIGDGKFKEQGNGYISEETFEELKCKYAYPGDLVISRLNAPYGRSCILPDTFDRFVLAVDNVILRPKAEFDKRYICYITQCSGFQFSVFDEAKGTTMKRISRTNLGNLAIPAPGIKDQIEISDFLDSQCLKIDSLQELTRASIEEYKKLKQAVITQAVTKGIRGKRPMKDSGVEWIGSIPEEWQVFRVANLYQEASDKGNDELPILTVSINSGVSDRELSDEESERVFVRSEDRSKYKRVQPGDLVYNMMRAWQGAFGAVRVDGMVSPAYVVARPMKRLDSRYVEYLFRTPEAIEEMHRYSYGVADFRLRLYWPQFRNIRMCVPSYEEQVEIADYIDNKVREILVLIQKKEQYLVELENYKKSLIYEYVTGKKEVPGHTKIESFTFLDLRGLLICRIMELGKLKGRVALQKQLFCIDCLVNKNPVTDYFRQKHGPYDYELEHYEQAAEDRGWIHVKAGSPVEYTQGRCYEDYRIHYQQYFGHIDDQIKKIVEFMNPMRSSEAERVATLLAAWNDFIIDGVIPTDDQLIDEVRHHWTPNKEHSPDSTWRNTLEKIKKNNFIPHGLCKHTCTN